MSQHDFNIANQGFPSFRSDLNSALEALATTSSGTAAPATTYANQLWYETDTNILHIRNEANSAWLDLMVIDQTTGSPSFNAGFVGIGTTSPGHQLDVQGTTDPIIRVRSTGTASTDDSLLRIQIGGTTANSLIHFGDSADADAGYLMYNHTSNFLAVGVNTGERMRIDSSGRLLVGDTTARATVNSTGTSAATPSLQLSGTSESTSGFGLYNYSATTTSDSFIAFNKSLNATIGSHTAVTSGTQLGGITFNGSDGVSYFSAANIFVEADYVDTGTVAGRLFFGTAGPGVGSPTPRMVIDNAGFVGIGTVSPTQMLEISSNNTTGSALNVLRFNDTDTSTIAGQETGSIEFFVNDISAGGTGVGSFITGAAVGTSGGGQLIFGTSPGAATGATESMRITGAGFVGMGGVTAPIVTLHVGGDTMTAGVVYNNQPAQASKAAAATLTIAELEGGLIQYTGAAATLTLPLGTSIETGTPNTFPVNMAFDFSVINTGSGTATLGTATGLTLVGSMAVTAGTSGMFRVRKTAANLYTVYRIA